MTRFVRFVDSDSKIDHKDHKMSMIILTKTHLLRKEHNLLINQRAYADATGVLLDTAGARLRPIAYRTIDRVRRYRLCEAVTTLRPREVAAGAVKRLVEAATLPDDAIYVGGAEALPGAHVFFEWIVGADADAAARLRAVQNAFVVALANSRMCASQIIESLEALRVLIAIQPDVLRYVLVGGDVPDLDNLSPAFALVNNTLFEKVAA